MKQNKIIATIALMFLGIYFINGQSSSLDETSPDGRYQLFLNEKDIDNNSRYFESYVVDLQSGDKIILAKNYKNDALVPNWFWDKNSQYLIFEGHEYGSISKLQIWDLEDRFILYELQGSIPYERSEVAELWDNQNEVLTFYSFENIEAPKTLVLDLKTRKVKQIVEALDEMVTRD